MLGLVFAWIVTFSLGAWRHERGYDGRGVMAPVVLLFLFLGNLDRSSADSQSINSIRIYCDSRCWIRVQVSPKTLIELLENRYFPRLQ